MTFSEPALLLVISGHKEIEVGNNRYVARAGEMLIVPGDTNLWLGKYPDETSGKYLGLGLRFDLDTITQFQTMYRQFDESWDLSPQWSSTVPDKLIAWLTDLLRWSREYSVTTQVLRHRLVELLLLLTQQGIGGNILISRSASWRQRVSHMIRVNPARDWRCQEVSYQLGASESTLRRKLKLEDTSFREILEETRLMSGLQLIQETDMPIGRIADTVGYNSQSRFTNRFKMRFEATPTELRKGKVELREELLDITG